MTPDKHRAGRQAQDHRHPVTYPAAGGRVGDRGQHRQQPCPVASQGLRSGEQLADRGVGQG
jgi:hypothetical protein